MTVEEAIIDKVRVLPPEKQQEVLAFIEFLDANEWEHIFDTPRRERTGILSSTS